MCKLVVLISVIFSWHFILFSQERLESSSDLSILTEPYLGQKLPGTIPEIFANGIVSTLRHEHSFPSFSPDGKQVLWNSLFTGNYNFKFPMKIISSKYNNMMWSEPGFFEFIPTSNSGEAFFAPDGSRIYFSSTSNAYENEGSITRQDIWYIEKTETGWNTPKNLGNQINTPNTESQPTVTRDLTLYYVGYYEDGKNNYGIYRSEMLAGQYQKPELLPENINSEFIDWTPFIAPDENYLLFSSFRPEGYGSGDIYISYRNKDNTWTEPINLGSTINEKSNERYPYVSPDGKYLFFVSDKVDKELLDGESNSLKDYIEKYSSPGNGFGDIYWVNAKIIEDIKPMESK